MKSNQKLHMQSSVALCMSKSMDFKIEEEKLVGRVYLVLFTIKDRKKETSSLKNKFFDWNELGAWYNKV